MKNRLLLSVILWFFIAASFSQEIGIGQWRTHLPYQKVIDVIAFDKVVYAATPFNIFTYNFQDNRIERIDKVKGLNDIGISKIKYHADTRSLLIAYTNTNMDLLREDGSIINISDIKNKEILGNKTINNIEFRDDMAYLSCGFGIVVLDMNKLEIRDTWYIGPEGSFIDVQDLAYNDTSFFAATENGIYYARIDAPNLADFNQWHKENRIPQPNRFFNQIETFSGSIVVNYEAEDYDGDQLYRFNGSTWDTLFPDNKNRHFQLNTKHDQLLISERGVVTVVNTDFNKEFIIWKPDQMFLRPQACDRDNDGNYWVGDLNLGLLRVWNNGWSGETIRPNGPGTPSVFDMDAGGENVWVAAGGHKSNWGQMYMRDGVFSFIDENWFTHNYKNTEAFDTISDFVCTKVDPANHNITYVGTWGKGLIKFENSELTTIYNQTNSTLRPWIAAEYLTLVSGLDFDSDGNLWVANSGSPELLSVMMKDGTWKSFNLGGGLSGIDISKLMIDHQNQKWIFKRKEGFLIVFNDGNTLDDPTDDKAKVLSSSTGNGAIPGTGVFAMATDQDGEVWIGSDKGICVFSNPELIFEPGANFDAHQILVPRNDGSGLADYLLETEQVTAIAVDGANNKWVGTERAGLFQFSPDGLKELHHFTAENSPLLSNSIIDIVINDAGEVFIGTTNGIISYKGEATPGKPTNDDVYAYPNPVRENYTGPIAIKGLVNNADVKITDSYGNTVYATKSEGGQAIWNGYTQDGHQVGSGVYLVFVTNSDGSEKIVTKILVIR